MHKATAHANLSGPLARDFKKYAGSAREHGSYAAYVRQALREKLDRDMAAKECQGECYQGCPGRVAPMSDNSTS